VAKYAHESQGSLGPARSAAFEEFRRKIEPAKHERERPEDTTTEILKKRIDTAKVKDDSKD
jgi:hypothetical protein